MRPSSGIAAATAVAFLFLAGGNGFAQGLPAGSAEAGFQVYLAQCVQCHNAAKGEPNNLAPNLFGIFGQEAAIQRGFLYSQELIGAGIIWTAEALDEWLRNPAQMVPNSKMDFPGLEAKDRADVIAFLKKNR